MSVLFYCPCNLGYNLECVGKISSSLPLTIALIFAQNELTLWALHCWDVTFFFDWL